MAHVDLILTLTGGLAAALVCGYVTFRLGLSPIVGYLIAGFAVGPNTPGFTADQGLAEQLAEIGVILLMFGVGLQFHLKELLAVRRVAVPGALVRSLLVTLLGAILGLACGWTWPASLVFGLALSVASTVVLMRVLADHGDLHTPAGHVAVGWLVVEDLFTVLVLVLLPAIFGRGEGGILGLLTSVGVSVVKVAAMIGLTFLVGERFIPWLLGRVAATRSRELFTLTVLVVALGIAVGSARLFDVSMALGAFLAGMVVGRSEFSLRAATEALPMRDAFAVLFFVSVGILFHPTAIVESPGLVAATLAIILLGKPLITLVAMVRLKQHVRVAVPVALSTAQIGEFSFILASTGKGLGLLDDQATDAIIAAAILSITLNPLLYRLSGPLVRALQRVIASPPEPGAGADAAGADSASDPVRFRAVVVGYGPVGRTSTRLLLENHVEPVVIEMNIDTVRQLGSRGIRAIYGDATHREILEKAGLTNAAVLILSSAYMHGSAETIRHARELNPQVLIFARATYLKEHAALRRAGADVVFSSEGEVALSMTESILRHLGATPEQLDVERERIRSELLGGSRELDGTSEDRLWPASGNGTDGVPDVLGESGGERSREDSQRATMSEGIRSGRDGVVGVVEKPEGMR
jgi:CPA2 family monovalent cation:H+ antiporter-2